jgi:hypothetical protein
MKLLLHTLMIFFGTLMAAGLVALGEPPHPAPAKAAMQPVDGESGIAEAGVR